MNNTNYDYFAECTGALTDYLSKRFDEDLEWHEGHLNGLPLYSLMIAIKELITEDVTGIVYVGNNNYIDEFFYSKTPLDVAHLYKIEIDDDDHCYYYITKIK